MSVKRDVMEARKEEGTSRGEYIQKMVAVGYQRPIIPSMVKCRAEDLAAHCPPPQCSARVEQEIMTRGSCG